MNYENKQKKTFIHVFKSAASICLTDANWFKKKTLSLEIGYVK